VTGEKRKRTPGPGGKETTLEREVMKSLTRFLKDDSGATAIEYGLIAAGIAIVIIVAVQLVGTNLDVIFDRIAAALTVPA
jgi:pilus assembly protein Flp/PilA